MKKKGFSLIELMIVVAIIGVLAAIAIPSFVNYILASKQAEYSSIVNGIASGESLYNVANDSFINVGIFGNGDNYSPVTTNLLNENTQALTASRWAADGQNIGYMPEKAFYGSARASRVLGNMQNTMVIFVVQDLDDDDSISQFIQNLSKDATTRDAYRNGTINHNGDKW